VLTRLREVYTGTLTAEFNHITSRHKKDWLMGQLEGKTGRQSERWLTREERRAVLRRLIKADGLETFLAHRFPSAKRFGLEGAEATIPGIQAVVDAAAAVGTESVVMGMAHRGRLNILNNVFGKPLGVICTEMKSEGRSSFNVGDVRYHLGGALHVGIKLTHSP
jgi:2-oxoglutarate dehydrogenase E1 component